MKTRLLGIYGLIFVFFGAIAAIFFHDTFLARAAYVEIGLGIIAIGIYLLKYFGDATKNLWRKRDVFFGGIGAALVLAILIGINVIVHAQWEDKKLDLTVNKIHSLSEESLETLERLPATIEIISFVTDLRARKLLTSLVEKYQAASNQVKFQNIDPDKDPAALAAYAAEVDQVVIRNPEIEKTITLDESQFNEQELTTALRRVMVGETKTIYFLQGHGEPEIADDKSQAGLFLAKFLLEREGYAVKSLDLLQQMNIPVDAEVIVAWGARSPLSEAELKLLEAFIKDKGKLVIGQDPILASTRDRVLPSGYESLLKPYGLKLGQSVLVQNISFQNQKIRSGTVLGVNYTQHPIVDRIQGNMTQFSLAQSVDTLGATTNYEETALVLSSEEVAQVSDLKSLNDRTPMKNSGPFALARIVTPKSETESSGPPDSALLVFGDSDFANNQNIQNAFNRDLFLNSFAYLLGETESITIRPKTWKTSTLEISADQKRGVYFASIFLIPQLIILFGLGIWAMRRNRV